MSRTVIPVDALERFIESCFLATEFAPDKAALITKTLLEADLRGLNTHGALRIPMYLKRVQKGVLDPHASPEVILESDNLVMVDAHNGMGQLASVKAMELAIDRASKSGICLAGVKNSNHYGTAAYYAMMASEKGLIGFSSSNTEPLMPGPGGAEKLVGNNPFSLAFPGGQYPDIVVDMAVSAAAIGKIILADKADGKIPAGWATDKEGYETTSSSQALDGGFLLPVGGPKGYALSLCIDILAGLLTGSGFGDKVRCPFHDYSGPQNLGHLFIAIHIPHLMAMDTYRERIESLIQRVKASKKRTDTQEIFLPGEIEHKKMQVNRTRGVELENTLIVELSDYAKELGVSDGLLTDHF